MTFPYDQARLQALFNDVDTRMASVEQIAREASQVQLRSKGLSEQDLAEIERVARGGKAPAELADLQTRIDSGEFSWKDVAEGRVLNDEGVQRALAGSVSDFQRAYTAIEEGQDIEDIIASGTPAARPPRADDDEDDGPSHFRKDAW
ncbi:MAG: hypothetical protein QOF58_4452 [Pseudonocardiales bacterium]|nr:hypothetical protein [Pseudonocardiales bacterium]